MRKLLDILKDHLIDQWFFPTWLAVFVYVFGLLGGMLLVSWLKGTL